MPSVSYAWSRAGLLAKLPKLETERVHPYYFFERGSRRTVGTQRVALGRGRGQCSHRHFMKIAPPVPTASSVQAKYVTPISRLMVAILFRMHAPLNADRSRLPRSKLIILLYAAVDFLERACVLLLVCLRWCSSDKMVNVTLSLFVQGSPEMRKRTVLLYACIFQSIVDMRH